MPESGHGSDACGSKWHAPPCSESAAQKKSFRPTRRGLQRSLGGQLIWTAHRSYLFKARLARYSSFPSLKVFGQAALAELYHFAYSIFALLPFVKKSFSFYVSPSSLMWIRLYIMYYTLELELILTQMTQKLMLRTEVYALALRAQNRKEDRA